MPARRPRRRFTPVTSSRTTRKRPRTGGRRRPGRNQRRGGIRTPDGRKRPYRFSRPATTQRTLRPRAGTLAAVPPGMRSQCDRDLVLGVLGGPLWTGRFLQTTGRDKEALLTRMAVECATSKRAPRDLFAAPTGRFPRRCLRRSGVAATTSAGCGPEARTGPEVSRTPAHAWFTLRGTVSIAWWLSGPPPPAMGVPGLYAHRRPDRGWWTWRLHRE